jgi:hypothetical protein
MLIGGSCRQIWSCDRSPEIDPLYSDKPASLAFSKDGKPLDAKEGPYRIVISDKRMARSVRRVTMLKIADV